MRTLFRYVVEFVLLARYTLDSEARASSQASLWATCRKVDENLLKFDVEPSLCEDGKRAEYKEVKLVKKVLKDACLTESGTCDERR